MLRLVIICVWYYYNDQKFHIFVHYTALYSHPYSNCNKNKIKNTLKNMIKIFHIHVHKLPSTVYTYLYHQFNCQINTSKIL